MYTDRLGCWAVDFSACGEAVPSNCCWTGESSENGRIVGSASRGEVFSVNEFDAGLVGDGSGFRFAAVGDAIGIPETWDRNCEKEGTSMRARDDCLRPCSGDVEGGLNEVGGAGKAADPVPSDEDAECE